MKPPTLLACITYSLSSSTPSKIVACSLSKTHFTQKFTPDSPIVVHKHLQHYFSPYMHGCQHDQSSLPFTSAASPRGTKINNYTSSSKPVISEAYHLLLAWINDTPKPTLLRHGLHNMIPQPNRTWLSKQSNYKTNSPKKQDRSACLLLCSLSPNWPRCVGKLIICIHPSAQKDDHHNASQLSSSPTSSLGLLGWGPSTPCWAVHTLPQISFHSQLPCINYNRSHATITKTKHIKQPRLQLFPLHPFKLTSNQAWQPLSIQGGDDCTFQDDCWSISSTIVTFLATSLY